MYYASRQPTIINTASIVANGMEKNSRIFFGETAHVQKKPCPILQHSDWPNKLKLDGWRYLEENHDPNLYNLTYSSITSYAAHFFLPQSTIAARRPN